MISLSSFTPRNYQTKGISYDLLLPDTAPFLIALTSNVVIIVGQIEQFTSVPVIGGTILRLQHLLLINLTNGLFFTLFSASLHLFSGDSFDNNFNGCPKKGLNFTDFAPC